MKSHLLWTATAILLIFAVGACASKRQFQEPTPEMREKIRTEMQKIINARDTNQDGLLTCDDIALNREILFKTADKNETLTLDIEEYYNLHWHDKLYIFLQLKDDDLNQDGVVTLEEFQERPDPFFFSADKDQDCILSPQELRAGMRSMMAEEGSRPRGGQRPGGGNRRRADTE